MRHTRGTVLDSPEHSRADIIIITIIIIIIVVVGPFWVEVLRGEQLRPAPSQAMLCSV